MGVIWQGRVKAEEVRFEKETKKRTERAAVIRIRAL